WAMYPAALLVALQDLATRTVPQYRTVLAGLIFVLVGWQFGRINLHDLRHGERDWLYDPPRAVRSMARQLVAIHPALPPQSRVLFLEDGFTTEEWTPLFILRLVYEDPALVVDRLKQDTRIPPGWEQFNSPDHVHYDHVFNYLAGRYVEVPLPADL